MFWCLYLVNILPKTLSMLESLRIWRNSHAVYCTVDHSINCPANLLISHSFYRFGSQVLRFFCDSCAVPICRECSLGRHAGHSFTYLQEALQDSRALTIQLLADAQQGRQAIQVSEQIQSLINRHQHKHLLFFFSFFCFVYPSCWFTWTSLWFTGATKLWLPKVINKDNT